MGSALIEACYSNGLFDKKHLGHLCDTKAEIDWMHLRGDWEIYLWTHRGCRQLFTGRRRLKSALEEAIGHDLATQIAHLTVLISFPNEDDAAP